MKTGSFVFIKNLVVSREILWGLVLSFLATGLYILALLIQPLFVASIILDLLSHSAAGVQIKVMWLAIAMVLSIGMSYCSAWLNNLVLQDVRCYSKSALYANILSRTPEFFLEFNEGAIEAAIVTASLAARTIVCDCLGMLVRATFFIVFSTILIFTIAPIYSAIFFLAAVVYLYMSYYLAHRSASYIASAIEITTEVSKEASDVIFNIESVQSNNMVHKEVSNIESRLGEESTRYRVGQGVLDKSELMQRAYLTMLFVFFIFAVVIDIKNNDESVVMFYIIGILSYTQLESVGKSMNSMFEQVHKLDSVLEKIDYFHGAVVGIGSVVKDIPASFDIAAHNLSFSYDKKKNIIDGFSMSISQGDRVIIGGSSGVGKTTLLKILSGQLQPQNGKVLIGGSEAYKLCLGQKSRLFSYISQNARLFNRTIFDNVTYGSTDSSYREVEELLLGLKLERLKQGGGASWLDTPIDRDGASVSGGERQRILIARAIINKRPILFLDEATSALDSETEKKVLAELHRRMPGTTIVTVSHHPHADLHGYRVVTLPSDASNLAADPDHGLS